MTFTRREIVILIVGLCTLSFLGVLMFNRLRHTPPELATESKPAIPDAFSRAVTFRLDGLVFSTDRQKKTVLARNEKTGAPVWESQGEDRLIVPGAAFPLDLSPAGELWVANVGKKRLEQLDPKTGRFIASWQPKEPFAGCCNPVRFAALARGRFITMEKGTRQVCIYQPSGELERIVTSALSASEDDYYLYHTDKTVYIYDAGTRMQLQVPYE